MSGEAIAALALAVVALLSVLARSWGLSRSIVLDARDASRLPVYRAAAVAGAPVAVVSVCVAIALLASRCGAS